jgi:hypothetical protein
VRGLWHLATDLLHKDLPMISWPAMASGPQENTTLAIGLLNKLTLLRKEETQLNESIPSQIGLLADLVSIGLKYNHLV